jgi:hypothetical protein
MFRRGFCHAVFNTKRLFPSTASLSQTLGSLCVRNYSQIVRNVIVFVFLLW